MEPWSCDAARMARWRAIDRERARRSARDRETAPESTEAPPVRERYERKPGVVLDRIASTAAVSLLRGPRSLWRRPADSATVSKPGGAC